MSRFSEKELNAMNDEAFIISVLLSKLEKLKDQDSALALKIRCSIRAMETRTRPNSKNWWAIGYWGSDGEAKSPDEVSDLEHVADLVKQGYLCGELYD